jgi:predicted HTH transcriptional regulator
LVKTSLEDVGGYTVIKIEVNQGDKLFYIKKYGLSVKGCYIRIGSTTREMTDEEIMAKYESNLPEH